MSLQKVKLLRTGAMVVCLAGVAGFLYGTLVWYKYNDTLSRSPQPATGRIYVMNMHGFAVYATEEERSRLGHIWNISFVIALVGGVAATLMSPDYRKKMGWRSLDSPIARPPHRKDGPG
ncbi:MAG TPA: hypothetical protein VFL79_00335 [Terriglobia bacterium]|nr:hypothetical protein [Terriglobia bacterium]